MKKTLAVLLTLALLLGVGFAMAEQTSLKVAVVVAGTLGDQGFYDSAVAGVDKLVADYGVTESYIECKNDPSMYSLGLVESAQNNDIVVAVGWEFWDPLCEVVPAMPDTKFIFIDNGLDGLGDNLLSITYAENEGSFLAGYVAMKLAPNATVGVIGGEDSETINNFIVGYKQGALYANPDGKVLDALYANDYEDPLKGYDLAKTLYAQGADVVFQVADKTGWGVFDAASELGKYAIGVDNDQKYIKPEAIVCSMMKRVGDSIYQVVSEYLTNGTFAGGTIINEGLSSGLIGLGYGDDTMTQQVGDDLKAEVEKLAQQIVNGEIIVETTR